MKNTDILDYIDNSLLELNKFEENYRLTKYEKSVVNKSKSTLNELKSVLKGKKGINSRLEKKINNLGLYSFRVFENTPLEDIIPKITYYFGNF